MALDYDFFINDLGFNTQITQNSPYERATAQFRKDQFDAAQTVGDQSLAGWWTRGQLSFHKGGGVKYYEVLEDQTVLNRFNDGNGVDPFTPGEVRVGARLDELSLGGVIDCVHIVHYTNGDRIIARCDDGKAYAVTVGDPLSSQTATAITTATAGSVSSIAAARFRVYLAVKNVIEVWDTTMGASTVLWTCTSGFDIVNIWYAKQRLWIVDGNGNWYVVGLEGGSFAAGDAKFTIKDYKWLVTSPSTWSLCDSPGPVYISAFNEVYSVSVDVDPSTLLPAIGAPNLVIELPAGEKIHCIAHSLGMLVMALDSGCRFAFITASGELVYGPKVTVANFNGVNRIAARGTKVSMGGFYFNEVGLWSFDLAQQVDDLQPSFSMEILSPGDSMGETGALNTPQGTVMWSSSRDKLYRLSKTAFSPTGSLITGFHRFGTLDAKHFESVLVRTGGSGGSVDVYRVDADLTSHLLDTISYPASVTEVSLGMDPPAERVALKFVLNTDATDPTKTPVLLGYQLKALPLPKRQRMIRVPLMLFDKESNRSGQKMGGKAWDRLAAIEELERSNAVVTFDDKVTGETGRAYIEALEVSRTAAAESRGTSFGGTLYVTLRVI